MRRLHRLAAALAPLWAAGMALAQATPEREPSRLVGAEGLLTLDYQTVPVRDGETLDLLGFHVLTRMNDWLYVGLGGHAPLFRGAYGGFMAFDATAHVQRRIFGRVHANAGISVGGGGGGKSVQQSRTLSGTGGFVKTYAGLAYDFGSFTAGLGVARMRFKDSAIDHSQLNLQVQAPFTYLLGRFDAAGSTLEPAERAELRAASAGSVGSMLTLGLDNLFQIDPQGTNKRNINLFELQYAHFMSPSVYWYFNAAGGYRGRPLYNQAFGGLGWRQPLGPRSNLYAQLGIGSGGYAPETIDTGPGLLVFPKLTAEYMLDRHLGLALSAGYLVAPRGSSKNATLGAALNYHIRSSERGTGSEAERLRGYRVNVYLQTESGVVFRSASQPDVHLLTMQIDSQLGPHLYVPVQVGAAFNAYLNLPGYGELLAGLGLQTRHLRGDRWQFFGQLMVGANPHGVVYKTALGLNLALSDQWALHASGGQTFAGLGEKKNAYRSNHVGLGLAYRFSIPNR